MPAFHLSESEITAVVAYIHTQVTKAEAQKGGRRGVDVSDLQTGNAEAGKRYFDGACASCHSPTGDLAGIGTRLKGLRLEQQMLYPRAAKSKVTVTLPDGHTVAGVLAYNDEFTVALRDAAGKYRSWPLDNVTIAISAPAEAHAELLPKYSDDDVHNLMAYLQSLK
jgi:cytochrome c oxidase cbb3-type subunit 3